MQCPSAVVGFACSMWSLIAHKCDKYMFTLKSNKNRTIVCLHYQDITEIAKPLFA